MKSFKSGSGTLDFGSDDEDTEGERDSPQTEQQSTQNDSQQAPSERSGAHQSSAGESRAEASGSAAERTAETQDYPYFVRRTNVTDERTVRLEAHVRESVADREAAFRSDVAAALDTNDVSKTDAREFALKFAFEHPEKVAELMREEGYGAI